MGKEGVRRDDVGGGGVENPKAKERSKLYLPTPTPSYPNKIH